VLEEDNFRVYGMTGVWFADDKQEDELFPQQILSYPPSDLFAICVDTKGDSMHLNLHQHPVCYQMRDMPHPNIVHPVSSNGMVNLSPFVWKTP